jgi:hypothetical protein
MMDEIMRDPEKVDESGESRNNNEQKALDDVTLDPRASVEQTGDIRQAEDVQEAFTSLVKNAGSEGPPIILPGLQDIGATMLSSSRTGDESMPGSAPGEESSAGSTAGGDASGTSSGSAGGAAAGDASGAGFGDAGGAAGGAAAGDTRAASGLGSAGGAATGDAGEAAGSGSAGGAAAGDVGEAVGSGSAGGAAAGDASAAAGLGSAGGAAAGDASGAGFGDAGGAAGGAAAGDAGEAVGSGSAGSAAAGDVQDGPTSHPDASPPDAGPQDAGEGTPPDESALPGDETPDTGETREVHSVNEDALLEIIQDWIPPELYAYVGEDGKITVVDANGKPVDSPPQLTADEASGHVTYDPLGYHGFYPGNVYDSGKLITFSIPLYHPPLENLYLYEDSSGTLKVVDANGKSVDSPPSVLSYEGKYYASDPNIKQPIDSAGTFKNPDNMFALQWYKPSMDGLFLYEDQDGKVTVVDETGKPVDSPPSVLSYEGKYYASDPTDKPAIDTQGAIKNPGNMVALQWYKPSMEGVYFYEGQDGKITVVDGNGKPVDSPPSVLSYEGKYYASDPTGKPAIDTQGAIKNPGNMVALQWYKPPMEGVYFYEGQDGKITVVDGNGKPVDSPPSVLSYEGKYYASDPTDKPAIDTQGAIKNPGNMVALQWYKPPMEGVYFYEGQDGKITVVDETGKLVDSPPSVFFYEGKYYASDPTDKPAIDTQGAIQNPDNMVALQWYTPPSSEPRPKHP